MVVALALSLLAACTTSVGVERLDPQDVHRQAADAARHLPRLLLNVDGLAAVLGASCDTSVINSATSRAAALLSQTLWLISCVAAVCCSIAAQILADDLSMLSTVRPIPRDHLASKS
ncbi:MAG: hypothetical protein IPM60_03350 [Rhodospirillales bacterium]|nr:hypothetical protein [Rhodospirillales bacterium]